VTGLREGCDAGEVLGYALIVDKHRYPTAAPAATLIYSGPWTESS